MSLTWDVSVFCFTADSYIDLAVQGSGCVAEMAASCEETKYIPVSSVDSVRLPADRDRDSGSNQCVGHCFSV